MVKGVALFSTKSIRGGISLDSSDVTEFIKEFWWFILILCVLILLFIIFVLLLVAYVIIFTVYQLCFSIRNAFNKICSTLLRASSNKNARLNTFSQNEELADSIKESEDIRKSFEETDAMLGPSPKKSFLRVYTFRRFLPHPFQFIRELLSKEENNVDASSEEG